MPQPEQHHPEIVLMEISVLIQPIGGEMMQRSLGTVFSGHCTGEKAFKVLKSVMAQTLQPFSTGRVIDI